MNVGVVGAGPVGSYAAYLLAKKGHKVTVYEEHKKIGAPVQCTGILTQSINDVMNVPKKTITNTLKHARIISPDQSQFKVKVNDIIVHRTKFDSHIADLAKKEGATYKLEHKYLSQTPKGASRFCSQEKLKNMKHEYLVGADGPNSAVRRLITDKKLKFWVGKQAIVKGNFDKNTYDVHLNIPGFFAWVVPENEEYARVGWACTRSVNKFNTFMDSIGKVVEYQGGVIPVYDPFMKTQSENTFIVGDAAGHVKATTGGGIIPGMKAARVLSETLGTKKNYETAWKKEIGTELFLHLLIRRMLNRFTESDYNSLVSLFSQDRMKTLLESQNRDKLSKSFLKIALSEPRLAKFAKVLFQKEHIA